jgi:hypothetical protein
MAAQRVVLHSPKGCLSGYKTCEMAAQVVAFRIDMNLAGSLFEMFRLQRIELNEVKDCLELNAFLGNALILHEIVA